MIEVILYILVFIMGAYFGSFYTLAVYRIPLGIDITRKHSFCPKCDHKLGIIDLFPIFSFIFLKGKCRYCGAKIKPRYCILEVISGLAFVAMAYSLNINIYNLEIDKLVILGFSFLYFAGLFIIAGIDKEKITVQKEVLIYTIIISVLYMLYLYIVQKLTIYRYIIYLIIILLLVIIDTLKIRRKAKESYLLNLLILAIAMSMFTGESVFLLTGIYTLLCCVLYVTLKKISIKNTKYVKKDKDEKVKLPIAFFMVTCNTIMYIFCEYIINYVK